ncbi:MAG: folate-binding protein YgfZ [Phycisphaerae bacterium]
MSFESPLLTAGPSTASPIDVGGARVSRMYADRDPEWAAATRGAALFDRADRALIRITGNDRSGWLHNLVTNAVSKLHVGEGRYAYACDVQGRIQFDLYYFIAADAILVDVQRDLVARALEHFDRFLITEDVQLSDESHAFHRIDCLGKDSDQIAARMGFAGLAAMPDLTLTQHDGASRTVVRIAHRGLSGFAHYAALREAPPVWQEAVDCGAFACGYETRDILRIHAGIPRFGQDFSTRSLPAETSQLDRAVSFHKGCYLGQEVVERMRSRGALAKKLVGVTGPADLAVALPVDLQIGDKVVGTLTSLTRVPDQAAPIGLATIRTVDRAESLKIAGTGDPITLRELPGAAESA